MNQQHRFAAAVAALSAVASLLVAIPHALATIPPAGFALVETITVPTTPQGSSVTSVTTLTAGTTYMIRASGTFIIGSACPFADAEYANFDASGVASCAGGLQDITPADGTDIGIGINSLPIGGAKSPSWGPYTTSHIYTISFLGLGAPIVLNYHDCNGCYGDNVGTLTVEIFAPSAVQTVIPTLSEWGLSMLVLLVATFGVVAWRRRAS